MSSNFFDIVEDRIQLVDDRMRLEFADYHPDLQAVLMYLLSSGGKRIRPTVTLLAGGMLEADSDSLLNLAAAVELLHTATLVHDDLIDQSPRRRGLETVQTKWFRDAALVGGDYLFALAATAIARSGDIRVLECLGRASVKICEGEISLVQHVIPLDQALDAYFFKIAGKTAVLFEEGLKAAGVASGASDAEVEALGRYGYGLGMAFQITDDVLDYVGDPAVLGKPVGGDLRRRQITLPLIYAAANGMAPTLHATIDRIDNGAGPDEIEELLDWVQRSVGIGRSQQEAHRFCLQACDALQVFPPSAIRDALEDIAWFVLAREK